MNLPPSTGSVTIEAPASDVYRLISDPPTMAGFAEETYRAVWLGGADKAKVGARFRGYNRNGVRRWVTVATITDHTPARCFAYDVHAPFGMPVSHWRYDLSETGDGCTVTETAWIKAPVWFVPFAITLTGRVNRPGANTEHIGATLRRLKEYAESQYG